MSDPLAPFARSAHQAIASIGEMKARQNNPAIGIFEVLSEELKAFESKIDNDHEVGLYVGGRSAMHVRTISRLSGQLLRFEGLDENGNRVVGIQHFSQLNLQMVQLEKLEAEPTRVGFLSE